MALFHDIKPSSSSFPIHLSADAERPTSLSRQNSAASTSGATGPASAASEAGPHNLGAGSKGEDRDRRAQAVNILKLLCESSLVAPFLVQLLTAK